MGEYRALTECAGVMGAEELEAAIRAVVDAAVADGRRVLESREGRQVLEVCGSAIFIM